MVEQLGSLNLQRPRNVYSKREQESTATRSVLIVKGPVQDEGQCTGLYNAHCCNHWVSSEALEQYIDREVSQSLNVSTVPCPQCLAEPCAKCATHGVKSARGVTLCCIPEQQVRSLLSEELMVRVAKRAFSVYREAHMGQTVKCPKPTCDYWCEIEDDRRLQDTASLLLDSDGQLSDDSASSASSMQPRHRPYHQGCSNQRAMQLHDSASEDSSDDEVHGYWADPFGFAASTSSGPASHNLLDETGIGCVLKSLV